MPNKPKWTPGPWKHVETGDCITAVAADNGEARFYSANSREDAAVFMAAPDLYEALEALLSVMKPGPDGHDALLHVWLNHPDKPERTPRTMARAALAKARGKKTDAE